MATLTTTGSTNINLRGTLGAIIEQGSASNINLSGVISANFHGGTTAMSWYRSKTFRRLTLVNSWKYTGGTQPTTPPTVGITSPYTYQSPNYTGALINTKAISHTNYTIQLGYTTTYQAGYSWSAYGWYTGSLGTGSYLFAMTATVGTTTAAATWYGYISGIGPCLATGTLVKMADGTTKAVEEIQPGDQIETKNVSGMPSQYMVSTITDLYDWSDSTLYMTPSTSTVLSNEVHVHSEILNINNGQLRVSETHNFLVEKELIDGTIGWTIRGAFNLVVGDKLIGDNGEEVVITSIEREFGEFDTYSIITDNDALYTAGGIVTHTGLDA